VGTTSSRVAYDLEWWRAWFVNPRSLASYYDTLLVECEDAMKEHTSTTLWLQHAFVMAHRVFGSATNTQISEVIILLVLAMIAWALVIIPGDQTGDGLRGIAHWWLRRE
jgi:hypothetical protein